ncbi:MAG: NAD(P)/FAD-dependent oxidoreductase, partial [Gemmatimonadota bacterium]|nr:NAD(P)/FAD-dependent oxidoreductase [Gemmatimonadota bacterium]
PKACAEYLSPEAARVLDRLGVLDAVHAAGAATLSGMRVVSVDGSGFTGRFRGARPFRGYRDFGLALPRAVLDHLLVEAATRRGAHLFERTAVLGLHECAVGRRTITVRTGRTESTVSARVVIGADGLHSRIARALGVVRWGRRKRVALVTHARDVPGMSDVGEMHVGREGYVGLAPIGRGLTNVAVVVDRHRLRPSGRSLSQFETLLSRFPIVADRVRQATLTEEVLAAGPFARLTVRATADHVALVGDAADFYDPFTGEGIYAALRGGELLAEVLISALERDALSAAGLASYDAMRRKEFGRKWFLERVVAFAVAHPAVLNHLSRRLAVRQQLADLLVGATGDFVPAAEVLRPSFMWQLVR